MSIEPARSNAAANIGGRRIIGVMTRKRVPLAVFTVCLITASAFAQAVPAVRPGEVVASVPTRADASQTYALYLPTAYTAQRTWPIVYVFDPGGRGANPLNLMKDAAEKYGYILAASNNARNGLLKPQTEAAQAVWQDTHERFSIDDKQVAFAGHSGGARLAAWVAQQCKCAAGLLLNGAGYPVAFPPTRDTAMPVFAVVGMLDFNYGEIVQLDAKLESLKYPHFLRRWDGPHAWAPAEVWHEAFAWLALSAMKQGRRPVDAAFVAAELAQAAERAESLEQIGSAYFSWQNYRQTTALFVGLGDASAMSERAVSLGKLPEVRSGQGDEKKEMEQRQSILADAMRLAGEGGDAAADFAADDFSGAARPAGGNLDTIKMQALRKIHRLRDELAKEKQPERLRALQRTQAGVALFTTDAGNALLAAKRLSAAHTQFVLAVAAQPERARSQIALARCVLLMGDKAEALRVLERAREAGVSAANLRDGSGKCRGV